MDKQIIVAKHAGFCFGVKKAVDMAFENAIAFEHQNKNLQALGELIHNEQVINQLTSKGVKVLDSIDDLKDESVIIRSHGAEKSVYEQAELNGLNLIDTTCVFVKRVHEIVKAHDQKGDYIVIAGNETHPEVKAIKSWAKDAIIISNAKEVDEITSDKQICVVAQTTLNKKTWADIVEAIEKKFIQVKIYHTICSATENRQDETREIAKQVDFMIVIGGKKSSNTKKLYDISVEICKKAQLIQNFSQINVKNLQKYGRIGIVAGASTPDWIIEDIIQKLKNKSEVAVNGKQ